MCRQISFLLLGVLPFSGLSQSDTLPTFRVRVWPERQIAECRQNILRAFSADDPAELQFWMDSLQRLEDGHFVGLYWDERWLLYLWLEQYAAVFEEVMRFADIVRAEEERVGPPKDSLFEVIDRQLYEGRFILFDRIKRAWLSTEERAFGALLVSYLLRLPIGEAEQEEYDAQLSAFLRQYPNSRFRKFIFRRMYTQPPAADWGLGLDLHFTNGSWSNGLGRSLHAPLGLSVSCFVLKKRWMGGLRANIGWTNVRRPIVHQGFEWEKDAPVTLVQGELEAGYWLYRKGRIQIGSVVAVGLSSIHPSTDEEGIYPPYYPEVFRFSGIHYAALIQADVSLSRAKNLAHSSYQGVRVRIGHTWPRLDAGNAAMRGDLFFFSIGYVVFGRRALN